MVFHLCANMELCSGDSKCNEWVVDPKVCVCVCVVGVECARPIHQCDWSFTSIRSIFMDGECIRVVEEAASKWWEQEGQIPVIQVSMVAWITVLRVEMKKREKTWESVTGYLDVGHQWKGDFWFEPSSWWDDTFLRRSREQAGQVVWYSHLFENFPQFIVIHTVKGFGVVNKVEVDVFLELLCFFDDSTDVGSLISGSSAFSKSSLNIWNFMVHILLKPGLKNFEYYFASLWDECNCAVVWTFFGIAFLWDWNENWSFPVLWPLLSFPNLLAYWVQHFHSIIF